MKALSWGRLAEAARAHGRRFAQCFPAILRLLSTQIGIDTMKSNSNRDTRSRRNRFAAGLSNLFHMRGQTPRAPEGPVRPIEVAAGQHLNLPSAPYHTGGLVADAEANREYLNSLLAQRSGSFFTNRDGTPIQFMGEGQFGMDFSASGDFSATGRLTVQPPGASPQVHVISTPQRGHGLLSSELARIIGERVALDIDRQALSGLPSGSYITAADLREGSISGMNVSGITVNRDSSHLVRFSNAAELNRLALQAEMDRAQFRADNLVIRDSNGNVVFSGRGPVTLTRNKEDITHPDAGKVVNRPIRTVFGRAVEEVRNKDGTVAIRPRREGTE